VWAWRDGAWEETVALGGPAIPVSGDGAPFYGLCELVPAGGRTMAVIGYEGATLTWSTADGESWVDGQPLPGGTSGLIAAMGRTLVYVTTEYSPIGQATTTIHTGTASP
jgi:hypothetical protein